MLWNYGYIPVLSEKVICYAVFWWNETNYRKTSLDEWELWLTLGGTESILNLSSFNLGNILLVVQFACFKPHGINCPWMKEG